MPKDPLSLFSDGKLAGKPLLAEEGLRNPAANEVWKRSEVDTLLDLYFSGTDPGRIAVMLKRNRKAIIRKLQEYIYNERNRASDYRPRQRQSRKGKRITWNEQQVIAECRKKGVSWSQIALVLQRGVDEIRNDEGVETAKALHRELKRAAVSLDMLLAYHYLYHVKKLTILSNKAYDDLKAEEIEYGCGSLLLGAFKVEDRVGGYPRHIRALAAYLEYKFTRH